MLTSYLVANAIVLPLTGWLASFFGRKRLLMASVAGFTIASLLCGLAPNLPLLVLFRLMQGATGGAMQPLSQAVMLEAFPPQERGKAMGFWGLGIVVAPILGTGARRMADRQLQLALGLLHQSAGRHRLAADDASCSSSIRRTCDREHEGSTTGASACSPSGSAPCSCCSTRGRREDWFSSAFITTLVVVVGARRSSCSWSTSGSRRNRSSTCASSRMRSYSTGVFLMTTLGFVLYGSLVLLPIMLQTLLGYPSLQAGIAMAPRGMGSFIGMPLDRHADRALRSAQDGRR